MIYVMKHDKFKKDISHNSADLIRNHKLDHLENPEQLDKEVRKGNHVCCWISPLESELNQLNYMYWDKTPEQAKADYWQANEEI
jgi:hypothetical protein